MATQFSHCSTILPSRFSRRSNWVAAANHTLAKRTPMAAL